jgi:hypothetical protein
VRLGGRWVTSLEALQRFAEALTPRFPRDLQTPPAIPAQSDFTETKPTSDSAAPAPAPRHHCSAAASLAVSGTD